MKQGQFAIGNEFLEKRQLQRHREGAGRFLFFALCLRTSVIFSESPHNPMLSLARQRNSRNPVGLPTPTFSGTPMRRMKKVMFICLVFGISIFTKLFAASDHPLASYHFVGGAALAGNTNAAKLRKIWAMPESVTLRNDVVEKLARASLKILGANSSDKNNAALLRPLFDDLLAAESWAELRHQSGLEFFLAVRLNETRARIWETNLLRVVKEKPSPFKTDAASGWQTKINGGTNLVKFTRAGKWTFVFIAGEHSEEQSDFIKRIEKKSTSGTNWLEADVDWPRLHPWLPLNFSPFKTARTEMKIASRGGEDLRTTIRATYPEKIDWKSAPWKIPTHVIRDPLISFTAAQNPAPFFKPSFSLLQLKPNPLTNQLYFWALSQMPFLSYVALPVSNATNISKIYAPQLAAAFNETLRQRDGGTLEVASNRVDLFWKGLPIIVPFLSPAKPTNGQELLLGGIFPVVPSTNNPPAELFSQIVGRNDLVFYDWEITETRLGQWLSLSQMLPFFSRELFLGKNPGQKRYTAAKVPEQLWLRAIGPLLGNTITEVTFKAPNELNLVRKSPIGLNSLELVLLSHWLAHPNFPSINPFVTVPGAETVPAGKSPPKKP